MSIQTELTRLTNAKAAIQTAIEGKGVTVPDGTMLDGMAALIESIEAGGVDLGDYFTDIFIGTLIPAEDVNCGNACSALGIGSNYMRVIIANNEFRKTIDGNHIRYAVWPRWCDSGTWRILYGKGTSASDEAWATVRSVYGGSTYLLAAGVRYEIFALDGPY